MNAEQQQQVQVVNVAIRLAVAFQKNSECVVCAKPIAESELTRALLLESNERLAHEGQCSTEALRHMFVHARRGLKGRRAMRGSR